jgi:hypothetical protein
MELDRMKQIWNTMDTGSAEPAVSITGKVDFFPQEIRSKGPVASMRRNLLLEIILVIISYTPVVIGFILYRHGWMKEISFAYLVLGILFGVYYYVKNRLLRSMLCVTCNVKTNLLRLVSLLKKYVRWYLLFGTLVFPVMMLFMAWIINLKLPSATGYSRIPEIYYWMILPVTLIMYFVNKKYIHHLYGRHINRLQLLVGEMEAD